MKSWEVEDEEFPDINFAAGIIAKSWIWIQFRSKNMKRKCGKSNQLFYFQVRESPAPLTIPIPTPASDWGGPVAW